MKRTLVAEFPDYVAKSSEVKEQMDAESLWAWWIKSPKELKGWRLFARRAALLQPSSAAAERVFSMLENLMSDNQSNSLGDRVEGALMMRYNSRLYL